MRKETIAYSAIETLCDMALQNLVPVGLCEVVFKESISQEPMYLSNERVSNIFVLISQTYYILKDFQRALESSNEALTWNSGNAMAYLKKGTALYQLHRDDEALKCFDKVLDIDFSLARPWTHKGYTLLRLGRHKEALVCFDRALKIDPTHSELDLGRGLCFHMMEKHQKVIECCDIALNKINKHLQKLLGAVPAFYEFKEGYLRSVPVKYKYRGDYYSYSQRYIPAPIRKI